MAVRLDRDPRRCSASKTAKPRQISVEAYFYPHGLAFVLTAGFGGVQLTLQQMVDHVLQLRRASTFRVEWQPDAAPKSHRMNNLALEARKI